MAHFITLTKREIDHKATGELVRAARLKAKRSLTSVAKALDHTPAYQSDIELGRRNWTAELFDRVMAEIKKTVKKKGEAAR